MANRLRMLEDEIGRHLKQSAASGELSQADGYGKPLDFGDGYLETPEELRMGFKMLKDAGFVPPEVEMMKKAASVRSELARARDPGEQKSLRARLLELEVALSMVRERAGDGRMR